MGYQINLSKDITTFDVFKISLPMMVSALSNHFMIILDQVILSRYSIEAMTGAASASVWCATLQCAAMSITSISGAFVGNYNGTKKYNLAGNPVWQMIWGSLGLFAVSVPLSMMAGRYCIPENLKTEGLPYFRILMFCVPITGVYNSLASFFISIGKGYIVTISAFLTNIINVCLDIILVFGYFGINTLKGSVGAATGTVSAWVSSVVILFVFFLGKKTRNRYGTFNFKLNISRLKEYLKLSIAGGVGHALEFSAWGVVYYTLSSIGKETALLQSIAVSVNTLLAFTAAGLEKGVMAITANLLGAKLKHKIFSV
ncbi:MAG: hypothetical protein LBU35_01650 [Holosporales bacterium]|nr:hypothetical protein [Holosporales bacterium]